MAKNLFNSVKMTRPNRNKFDLSHDVKMSLNMGYLYPTMVTECVPGDKFRIGCESMLRFSPLIAPIMHRVDVSMHYFFVPNRIVWPNWEKYITNTKEGENLPAFPTLVMNPTLWGAGLPDYMGIPPVPDTKSSVISALPFAALQKIWNEYYRDQNVMEEVDYLLEDGDNTAARGVALCTLRRRSWEHDYFTSALPFAQKGDPVVIPVGVPGNVPVKFNNADPSYEDNILTDQSGWVSSPDPATHGMQMPMNNDPELPVGMPYAETENLELGSTTINDLRRAFRLQEWLEKAARGGSRYIENILAHFGVRSSDKRLQRPEYITGTKSPVIISEVLNTTGTNEAPQGNMAGHGVSVTQGSYGGYYCEEHGYIIGVMSVMPKTAYMQGIPRHFLKWQDPFQFFWPSFAHLGEQEIQNQELYAFNTPNDDVATFGYVPRYAEYKFENNRVAGQMRTSLKHWHMAREFFTPPALNQTFIESTPTTRIFAVTEDNPNQLIAHVLHKVWASRLMPKFGTPTF